MTTQSIRRHRCPVDVFGKEGLANLAWSTVAEPIEWQRLRSRFRIDQVPAVVGEVHKGTSRISVPTVIIDRNQSLRR